MHNHGANFWFGLGVLPDAGLRRHMANVHCSVFTVPCPLKFFVQGGANSGGGEKWNSFELHPLFNSMTCHKRQSNKNLIKKSRKIKGPLAQEQGATCQEQRFAAPCVFLCCRQAWSPSSCPESA